MGALRKLQVNNNIRKKVFDSVRDYVITDKVLPGSKIDEAFLATRLGVSKTPVREALTILANEGIVEIIPNRGSFKVVLTNKDIQEIEMIREHIEGLIIRLAAKNMDQKTIQKLKDLLNEFERKDFDTEFADYVETNVRFYEIVYAASGSKRLLILIQSMRDLTHMMRIKYLHVKENVLYSLKGHRELIAAFEKGDAALAEDIRRKMLQVGYRFQLHE